MPDPILRPCVIIPAYNAQVTIGPLVRRLRALLLDVLVVNDGSTDRTACDAIEAGAIVISHLQRRGPKAALRSGLSYALERGHDPVVTMDADSRHALDDLPKLLGEARHAPATSTAQQNGFRLMRRQAVLDVVNRRHTGPFRLAADGARLIGAMLRSLAR